MTEGSHDRRTGFDERVGPGLTGREPGAERGRELHHRDEPASGELETGELPLDGRHPDRLRSDANEFDEPVEGDTVLVDRGESAADTRVVDRRQEVPLDDELEVADTVIAEAPLDADTVIVDRGVPDRVGGDLAEDEQTESTVVVDRPGMARSDRGAGSRDLRADASAVTETSGPRAETGPAGVGATGAPPRRRRRFGGRRTLEPAPLEPVDLRASVRGVGAGAIQSYRPRPLPKATALPAAQPIAEPVRDTTTVLPSIERRARRGALVALVALGASLTVGVIGAVTVLGLLVG